VIKLILNLYKMKTGIKFILALGLIIFTHVIHAQKTTKEITDKFFQIYKASPEKAVTYGFSTNEWFKGNQEGITDLESRLTKLIGVVGNYSGYEKINEKNIGSNYKLETYMLKYTRQPVKFTFIFYRPVSDWQIQNFYFNTDFDDDIEKMVH